MLLTLGKIFTAIAKDKKVKNVEAWVESRLNHCEISSDYRTFVHLKSNKKMWFGVRDTQFECKDFVLYREYSNVESLPITEYEIYTFSSLEDKEFFSLIQEAYTTEYDKIKDVRLFFELTPISLKVKTGYGYAALGTFAEGDDFTVETPLYCLTLGDSLVCQYFKEKTMLEYNMVKYGLRYQDLEKDILAENLNCRVFKEGKELKYRFVRKEKLPCLKDGWMVEWL